MKNKKLLTICCTIIAIMILALCLVACDDTSTKLSGTNANPDTNLDSDNQASSGDNFDGTQSQAIIEYSTSMDVAYIEKVNNDETIDTITIPATIVDNSVEYPVYGIDENAFENTTYKKIIISEGIERIYAKAFYNCQAESIELPQSITYIDKYAFMNCVNLKEINLPYTLGGMGDGIFAGCDSLTTLDLPYLPSTLANMFSNTQENIEYKDNITKIKVAGKDIWSQAFMNCKALEEVELGDDIIYMGNEVFANCENLTKVILPQNLKDINYGSFENCKSLAEIDLPDNLTSISSSAFRNCVSLANIELPQSLLFIWQSAFENCDSLQSIDIPQNVELINANAFNSCDNLASINIESQKLDFLAGGAFGNLPKLTNIVIPGSISVDNGAIFGGSNNIQSLTIPATSRNLRDLWGGEAPESLKKVTLTNTKEIKSGTFVYCDNIEEIILPEGLETIGYSAFKSCESLKKIELPSTVKTIKGSAFDRCYSLESMYIPEGVETIDYYVFYPTIIIKTQVQERPAGWDASAFYRGVVIWDCDNNNLTEDGEEIATIGGFDYLLKDNEATLHSANNNDDLNIVVPEKVEYNGIEYSVTSIRCFAFDSSDIQSVVLPQSVIYIGEDAFNWCDKLTSVTMPGVKCIGFSAFRYCLSLEQVSLPSTLIEISQYAFANCEALTSVTIPASVHSVFKDFVQGCDNLEQIVFEDTQDWRYVNIQNGEEIYCDFSAPVNNVQIFLSKEDNKLYYHGEYVDWRTA